MLRRHLQSDPSIPAEQFQKILELKITSDTSQVAAVRKQIETLTQQHGFTPDATASIGLSLNEAIANIIRHAYSGESQKPISITVELSPPGTVDSALPATAIRIALRDWGNGLHPSQTLLPGPHDPLRPGGLGLICLHKLMDQVKYQTQPDGMLLTLTKWNTRLASQEAK